MTIESQCFLHVTKIHFYTYVILTLLFVTVVLGNSNSSTDELIDSANILLVNQQYEDASQIFRDIIIENPEDFRALYFLLAVYQSQILDYESYAVHGEPFIAFADSVLREMKGMLKKLSGKDSLDCLFYIANTYGGKGVVEAKTGNWFSAVKNARNSLHLLKFVKNIDITYYPTYLGIGVFNYYLSKNMKWLPFFGDKREEGIAEIKMATNAPSPYNIAAKNSLCWILIEEGRYASADSVCKTVLNEFPENTVFIRIAACIALWTQNWEKTIIISKKLIALSMEQKPINWSNLLMGYSAVVESFKMLNQNDKCVQTANTALSLTVPEEFKQISYVREHLSKIRKFKEQAER